MTVTNLSCYLAVCFLTEEQKHWGWLIIEVNLYANKYSTYRIVSLYPSLSLYLKVMKGSLCAVQICSLDLLPGVEGDSSCSLNMVQVFHGGPTQVQLSRSCLCTDPEDASNFWAVAGDETCKAVSDFSVQVVAIGSICSSCALGKGMALSQAPDIESQTLLIHRQKKRTVRGSNETQWSARCVQKAPGLESGIRDVLAGLWDYISYLGFMFICITCTHSFCIDGQSLAETTRKSFVFFFLCLLLSLFRKTKAIGWAYVLCVRRRQWSYFWY